MSAGAHPNTDGFFNFCKALVGKTVLVYTTSTKRETVTGELQAVHQDSIVVKAGNDTILINRDGIVALYQVVLRQSVVAGQV